MEEASGNPAKNDEGNDPDLPDYEDTAEGPSTPAAVSSTNASEDSVAIPEQDNGDRKIEQNEIPEEPETATGSEEHPGKVTSSTHIHFLRSSIDIQSEETSANLMISGMASSSGRLELPSQETITLRRGTTKNFPNILGGVRRESEISRETLDIVDADMLQTPFGISVSIQTDATSWFHDHIYKTSPRKTQEEQIPLQDLLDAESQDLTYLDILCDTEFQDDFIKLFQKSLQTLSSVGPPTIIAHRPESSRTNIHIELPKDQLETCEFCGSPMMKFPSFISLEHIAQWGDLFCCQKCRELHEFIVNEETHYPVEVGKIDIAPHHAHGTEAERQKAKERARQRLRERQMAKEYAFIAENETEKTVIPVYSPDYKQLDTLSFSLAQDTVNWRLIPPVKKDVKLPPQEDTYTISCCDFTIAGGKLVKNQFLQQYYKNGVKFLTMFPDGTAQIFYPSGNLAIIVVQKIESAGYICIVKEDKAEKAEIQAVLDSCGKGTCYHPNRFVWINITVRGGQCSDQAGNKVKTWVWPNDLQKQKPSTSFKPIFLSLNVNVGVRILGQDKIVISFLAMGKQAKVNIGAKVEPLAEHNPWPKDVAEEDLLLFATRLKILRIFAKLQRYVDFPTSDWWTKLQLPSFLLKRTLKLIYLCKECEINSALDSLIMGIVNSPT